jgi:hypothetical protein
MLKIFNFINPSNRKRFIVLIFTLLFAMCSLSACSIDSSKYVKTEENVENVKSEEDSDENTTDTLNEFSEFFMSSDGLDFLATTWAFIKAYFNSDIITMEKYLLVGEKAEAYSKDVFNDIKYLNLQWSFSKIISENEIYVTYIFEIEGDSLTYFDLKVKKVEDEWKVYFYTLDK